MDVSKYLEFARLYREGKIPFPLKNGIKPFLNYKRIHPLKQQEISEILPALSNCRLIVFGSTITGLCNVSSDLDLCLEFGSNANEEEILKHISRVTKGNCDIVLYSNVVGSNLEESVRGGVVVYDDLV